MKDGLDQGLTPDQLKTMADNFVLMGDKLQSISEGLTMFGVKSSMMIPAVPTIDTELTSMIYDTNNVMRSAFSEVVLNDHQALMVIRLAGNLKDTEKDRLTANIAKVIDKANFTQLTTTMSGKTVLDAALRAEMKSSMMMMIGLAVLVMFGVLLLVFKVKWRMLSLAVVFISVIATLGFMGWIKVPVTMVSMAVFPIIIGLGIDYSIQFHNRYEEEKSVKETTEKIGKAIAIAVFATILGFISLYASPVPMIQDFGKMLTIGVIISFLGSIFLLFPILHIGSQNEKPKKITKVEDKLNNAGVMDKFLASTTRLMIKLTVPVLLLFVLVAGAGFAVDQYVAVETDIEKFMPQDLQALTDIHTIRAAVGTTDQIVVYITTDNVLKESNLTWIKNSSENIIAKYPESVVSIKSIDSLIQLITDGKETAYTDVLTM
jgi:hydrophobe/amphiphile efflux-3 (HAE3) family protein